MDKLKAGIPDVSYTFDTATKECHVIGMASETFVGAYDQTTCTITPKWTNPDPPTWKTVVGNCQRIDFAATQRVINEGVVANKAACQ